MYALKDIDFTVHTSMLLCYGLKTKAVILLDYKAAATRHLKGWVDKYDIFLCSAELLRGRHK